MNDELSDRLKKLGVHLGANHLKSPTQPVGLPNLINPKFEFQNRFGHSIAVDQNYDRDYIHGLKAYFNDSLPKKQIILSEKANLLFKDCVFILKVLLDLS